MFTSEFQKEEACRSIETYDTTIKMLLAEMLDINHKEELLGFAQTEFPKLLESQEKLKPYQDLWFLIREKNEKMEQWKKIKPVFTLDPEDIEKDVK